MIYAHSNDSFKVDKHDSYLHWITVLNLGSLDPAKQIASTHIELAQDTGNLLTSTCPGKSLNSDIIHYGLAYQNQTVVGHDMQQVVQTFDGCGSGSTEDSRKEWKLENDYHNLCFGKKSCTLNLTMSELLDSSCIVELGKRWGGDTTNGPARLYFQALCTQDTLYITET